jgi:hypothetical protein
MEGTKSGGKNGAKKWRKSKTCIGRLGPQSSWAYIIFLSDGLKVNQKNRFKYGK